MAKATKSKHEASGLTPEPLSRRLKLSDEEETKEESDELMNQTEAAQDILAELKNMKAQTAFLLAQQADNLREKARKEFIVAGWSMFAADSEDLETQGVQLETQTESRERWVKELAKKAGITSFYYRDWTFSHQTRGEALSPLTIVTVSQPWQRNKLFDYTKKHAGTDKLKERFFLKEREEQDWNRITEKFGNFQGSSHTNANHLKVQPQISLWDRITGLPLKIAMTVAEQAGISFRHNWRDLTLTEKDSGEYVLWIHYSPDDGTVIVYLSEKHIPDSTTFTHTYEARFNEILNGGGKTKGKGKGRGTGSQDKEPSLPMTHSSHARCSKFPFSLKARVVPDLENHWDVWRTLWNEAVKKACSPYTVMTS